MIKYSIELIEETKQKKKYRDTNVIWNKASLNNPDNIGFSCIEIIMKNKPKSLQEFESVFFHNMSYCLFDNISNLFYNELKEKIPATNYTKDEIDLYCYIRFIYDTYIGYRAEQEIKKKIEYFLINNGYPFELIHSTSYEDLRYAIDYKSLDPTTQQNIPFAIQIKPITYKFIKSPSKMIDYKKNKKYKEDTNEDVIYIYYEKKNIEEYEIKEGLGEVLKRVMEWSENNFEK